MVIIGLPIPIIDSSYTSFYSRQKRLDKEERLKKNRNLTNDKHLIVPETTD